VRDLIRMTADLGAPVLRVFAAWPGVTIDDGIAKYLTDRRDFRETHLESAPEETWSRCVEGLIEAGRWAGEHGVTLALQNHPPVTNTPADMLRMIRDVGSPPVQACRGPPPAAAQGGASMLETAHAVRGLQVLSHFGGEYERRADGSVLGHVRHPDETLT